MESSIGCLFFFLLALLSLSSLYLKCDYVMHVSEWYGLDRTSLLLMNQLKIVYQAIQLLLIMYHSLDM